MDIISIVSFIGAGAITGAITAFLIHFLKQNTEKWNKKENEIQEGLKEREYPYNPPFENKKECEESMIWIGENIQHRQNFFNNIVLPIFKKGLATRKRKKDLYKFIKIHCYLELGEEIEFDEVIEQFCPYCKDALIDYVDVNKERKERWNEAIENRVNSIMRQRDDDA